MPRSSTPPPPEPTTSAGYCPRGGASPLTLSLAALFLLPFVVIGLSVLLFGVGPKMVDWARAQSWHATTAVVESAASVWEPQPRGSGGYRVEVRYRYEVNGSVYRGNRASFHEGPNNGLQKQLGDWLEGAQRSGTPIQVWVNPDQPAESIADRGLRLDLLALELVVPLGFTGVGLGMWWVLLRIWLSLRLKRKAANARHTLSPEHQNPVRHRKPF